MLNSAQLARIDLNLLLVFDLLFEERNAGRAAARLNLSPSAISHALRRLRAMLNDPLFLPTPKGMMPTARAEAMAPAIRDIVDRVAGVIASAEKFDPATASRRYRIGAPDGVASVLIPDLVERVRDTAPNVDLAFIQLLPTSGASDPLGAWRGTLAGLSAGSIDVAVLPIHPPSASFAGAFLYDEEFVAVVRRGHPYVGNPTVDAYAAEEHVLVSATGDPSGLMDWALAEKGLKRRVALTVPSFFMAMAAASVSDLIAAVPRSFARRFARNFDVELAVVPLEYRPSPLHAIVPAPATLDQSIVWILQEMEGVARMLESGSPE